MALKGLDEIHDLDVRLTVLEQQFSTQNTQIIERLGSLHSVIRELHDKVDQNILGFTVQLTESKGEADLLKADVAHAKKDIAKLNSRMGKIVGGIFSVLTAAVTGLFSIWNKL